MNGYLTGYGNNPVTKDDPFSRAELVDFKSQSTIASGGIARDLFLRTLPVDQYLRYRQKAPLKLASNDDFRDANVAATLVYAPPTPGWSILSHSCRNRISKTAVDIALHGVDSILNKPAWSSLRVKEELLFRLKSEGSDNWNWMIDDWKNRYGSKTVSKWGGKDDPIAWLFTTVEDVLAKVIPLKSGHLGLQREIARECARLTSGNQGKRSEWIEAFIPDFARAKFTADRLAFDFKNKKNASKVEKLVEQLITDVTARFGEALLPIASPLARYGEKSEMVVIDRREIEAYRTLENLIQSHFDQRGVERPLSLALFGPPGAGKSFAIKQIVAQVKPNRDIVNIPVNLSEFTEVRQLADKFKEISDGIAKKKTPIVFFDEFDASFGEQPLGWLKSFLAAMEDGVYQGSTVKEAVFVFAGGTSSTFAEFSRHSRMRSDPLWIEFAKAKGPDFVSRLKGHVDLMGVNPMGPEDDLYIIRRAVFLRSILTKLLNLKSDQVSPVNPDLLYALLHAPSYRHGGRSMRIILELCHRNGELRKSSIPSVSQLDMHVDGKAFMDLVIRGADQDDPI